MKQAEILTIPIDSIESNFDDFLSPESNKRIIFSGPFGIGKTFFLNKFFQSRNTSYLPIFLRPVNYSLLSNEDIFRLIKYDILLQLINNDGFNIEEEFSFSHANFTKSFISENGFLILYNLLKLLPKIQSTMEGFEKLAEIIKAYKKGKANLNKNPDVEMLFEFQHETQDNFLLEYDHVSQFIANKLDDIAHSGKPGLSLKKVLIIDDLDRLDPEHIFRLFNVFSAHFDQVNYYSNGNDIKDNKFGFDKIILVCDIENIRKLFAHRYGMGVDFSGYIDKFYSKRIYYLFHCKTFENHIYPFLKNEFIKLRLSDHLENTLKLYFQLLFQGNQLNIRDINRIGDLHLSTIITKENTFINDEIQLNKLNAPSNAKLKNYTICTALYIFSHHFGSSSILKEKIQNAFINIDSKEDEYSYYRYSEIFPTLILFADYKNHKFQIKDNEPLAYTYNGYPYEINGGYEDQHYKEGIMWYRVNITQSNYKVSKGLFFKSLTEASINIIDSGILRI